MQPTSYRAGRRRPARRSLRLAVAALGVATAAISGATLAQDVPERVLRMGMEIYRTKGNCQECHAWHGNGDQGYGGIASSLRGTALDRELMTEVVRCGRPGTQMPKHDTRAYRDKNCYGMDQADLVEIAATPKNYLHPREVAAVVEYIFDSYVGRGEPNLEDCIKFWGETTRQCDSFRAE